MTKNIVRDITIGVILTSLFAFLLIAFAIEGGQETGVDVSELQSDKLNYTGINSTLQSAQSQSESWKTTFTEGKFTVLGTGLILVGTIVSVVKTIWGVITIPYTLFAQMMNDVLKIPTVVTNILFFVFILTLIFGMWRLMKQGD